MPWETYWKMAILSRNNVGTGVRCRSSSIEISKSLLYREHNGKEIHEIDMPQSIQCPISLTLLLWGSSARKYKWFIILCCG